MRELSMRLDSLFVEGPDDGVVVNALVRKLLGQEIGRAKERKIVKRNDAAPGVEGAIDLFDKALGIVGENHRVGLLIDRDGVDGKPDRWPAVSAALARRGFTPPDAPPRAGWTHDGLPRSSRVGVWLMPDNEAFGDLETLLARMVPSDDALWPYAQGATDLAPACQARFKPKDQRKALIHAWTAWQDEPGGGYGLALDRGALRATGHPDAAALAEWFRRLFLEL